MARETSKAQVTPKRQCWECLRRRLVCDFSRPACNKCCAAGVVCPGYDERKPLTWLTPGQVTSRSRRRPPLPGAGGTRAIVTPSDSGETTDRTNDPTQNAESGVMEATVPHIELRSETCTVVRAVYYCKSNPPHAPAAGNIAVQLKLTFPFATDPTIQFTELAEPFRRCYAIDNAPWWPRETLSLCLASEVNTALVHDSLEAQRNVFVVSIAVVGNTTSPSFDQILATSHPDLTDLMLEMYGDGLNPALLCPPPLFLDIIKINHLRFQGRNASLINESTQSAANVLLMQIDRLSPEKWIKSDTSLREEWLLLGRIYQSAVALYCILSLQSVSVLPSTLQLNAMRTRHGGHLFPLLKKALASQRIKKCMLWPLVVAGVDAANYGPAAREFVNKHLLEMSQDLGTPVPLLAKVVLKRFWASGKTRWDDCFDRPYAFVA
ncbi:hypothetical protein PRK78_005030 [Emydomyces testavorans]|uniref:Zn(2)-C6 fungal-type domain-containing protein n=1 Tax=Emydomyces testavorans TaxID=2070801 RepID=A0AAF0DLA4_9EURO|nr:hypothetical protein PRK78_005030 [Emydomyces testavorans]